MIRNYFEKEIIFAVIILSVGAGWIFLTPLISPRTANQEQVFPYVGFLVPEITLNTPDGQEVQLSDLRGKPVIINFWASWCPPCRVEMPALQKTYENYQKDGLIILEINSSYQDDLSIALPFIQKMGLTFPILLDYNGLASKIFRVNALPTSVFIDKNGIIRRIVVGAMPEALLRSEIPALFLQEQ
jgi:cytochrome c biogenesis protein CcmG, thiol:disulfide interchange protein DsbE